MNDFTGTIPASALSLTTLWYFDVAGNDLEGDIADVLANLPTTIVSLNLSANDFYGEIPNTIDNFSGLYTLRLESNDRLVGELPIEIINLTSMNYFDIRYTYLCEPADTSYDTWKAGITYYYTPICGYQGQDLTIVGLSTIPEDLEPGVPF